MLLIPGDTFSVDREIPASAGNCITFLCGIRIRLLHVDSNSVPACSDYIRLFLLNYIVVHHYKTKFPESLECLLSGSGKNYDADPDPRPLAVIDLQLVGSTYLLAGSAASLSLFCDNTPHPQAIRPVGPLHPPPPRFPSQGVSRVPTPPRKQGMGRSRAKEFVSAYTFTPRHSVLPLPLFHCV